MHPTPQLAAANKTTSSAQVTAIGEVYDLDQYSGLQYRIRGDGRTYIANLRLDNFTGQATDVWQVPFRTVYAHPPVPPLHQPFCSVTAAQRS